MVQEPQKDILIEELHLKINQLENRVKDLSKKIRLDSSLYSKILDALPLNVFLEDRMGRTIFANQEACKNNGMKLEELVGKTVFDFFPPEIAKMQRNIDLQVWEDRKLLTKELKVGFQGKESYVFTGKTIIQLQESNEEYLLGFGIDITDKKMAEDQIVQMAYHDALTGLPNRWLIESFLQTYLAKALEKPSKLGVLLLDLDHFKVINDSLGHQAGDILLKAVSKRLNKIAGSENILARFGGDEFILLLPDIETDSQAKNMCELIIKVFEKPFSIYGQKFNITPSIGVSFYPQHGDDINTLIKSADLAMYHSKDKGRNCYSIFASTMKEHAMVRMDMELLLRKAIKNNEFVIHYQPKLNLKTGQIYGMEALVRWKDRENHILYPDSFIGIAEESGLIVPIGEQVLRLACTECRKWHEEGFEHLSVSVNISPSQFQNENLENMIMTVLKETGLPPDALEIELTESTIMKDPANAAAILGNLKKLGINISIDDFGTGFSSLSYLKYFPIDILKIDKSFIANLEWDSGNSAIATAVIGLAHNLNLKVVAEGVETEEQLVFLQKGGCHFVQGYLISKPIEIVGSIKEFIKERVSL